MRMCAAGIAVAVACSAAAAAGHTRDGLARLEEAVAAHPDDPDLRLALVRALDDAGRGAEALAALEALAARWPEHRPDLPLALGIRLYEAGRDSEALRWLERALAGDPASGPARLYRGLALKRSGRLEEAEAEFERAGEATPELRDDSALLRGLLRLELGDERGGEGLLRRAIALDPGGEPAQSARLVLGERARPRPARIELEGVGGVEYDSNVVLDSGTDLPGLGGSREDARFTWAAALTTRPVIRERWRVAAGYRYDQSVHLDLHDYDTRAHTGFVSAGFDAGRRLLLQMDGLVGYAELGGDPYLLRGLLRPGARLALGPRAGALRLYAEGEALDYEEPAPLPSLRRDAWSYGAGLEHAVALPWREGAFAALGAGYRRSDAADGTDLLGFEDAYDHHRVQGTLRLGAPLAFGLASDLCFGFGHERYDHRNVIDFLSGVLGGGSLDPADARRRRDLVADLWIRLARPLTRFAAAELSWRFTDRDSNVSLYAYDRHVVGVALRVQPMQLWEGE